MAMFSVAFQVEAADLAEAEALVAQWTVTPGSLLMPITGSVQSTFPPTEVVGSGVIGDTLNAAKDDTDTDVGGESDTDE